MAAAPPPTVDVLRMAPRALGIGFALFLSVFALDVFDEATGFVDTAIALLAHLVPTLALLATVAVAWRHEWIGALVFGGLGVAYVAFVRGFPIATYAVIAGPALATAALYLASWRLRLKLPPTQ